MLLRSANRVPTGRFYHSIKWDGYRAILLVSRSGIRLWTRSGREITERVPELQVLSKQCKPGIFDGELVALGEDGLPHFEWLASKRRPKTLVLFDVLARRGKPVLELPIEKRLDMLDEMVPDQTPEVLRCVTFSDGEALLKRCEALGLEGICSKRHGSTYVEGVRNLNWLKIRTRAGHATIRKRFENVGRRRAW